MKCPYCGFKFNAFAMNSKELPDVAPALCENCGEIGVFILETRDVIKARAEIMEALKKSPAWTTLEPIQSAIKKRNNAQNN